MLFEQWERQKVMSSVLCAVRKVLHQVFAVQRISDALLMQWEV